MRTSEHTIISQRACGCMKILEDLASEDRLSSLSILDVKKLMIKRRLQIETLQLNEYYRQITDASLTLKNVCFMRQFRQPHSLDDFVVERAEGSDAPPEETEIFIFDNKRYRLYERVDSYCDFQLEYFESRMREVQLANCRRILLCPDYSFYGLLKSYYLSQADYKLFGVVAYINQLVERLYSYRNVVNHLVYVFDQIVEIMRILHSAGLTLAGDFSSLVICNGVAKINATALVVAVPPTLSSGIREDFKSLKELLCACVPAFISARNRQFSEDVNQLFSFVNQAVQNIESPSGEAYEESQLYGVRHASYSEIIANLPFFSTPLFPHFLSADVLTAQSPISIVEPSELPAVMQIEYGREAPPKAVCRTQSEQFVQTCSLSARQSQNALKYYGRVGDNVDSQYDGRVATSRLVELAMDFQGPQRRGFYAKSVKAKKKPDSGDSRSKSARSREIGLLGEERSATAQRARVSMLPARRQLASAVFFAPKKGLRGQTKVGSPESPPVVEPLLNIDVPGREGQCASRAEIKSIIRALLE